MKKILSVVFCVMCITTLLGQVPNQFNYQAVVRDNAGNILSNQSVSFRISIIQGSMYGTSVYIETQKDTTNSYGLSVLKIGAGDPQYGSMTGINWANGPYYLKVELDQNGGTSYVTMGITQLLSVPYALHAGKANTLGMAGSSGQTLRHDGTSWTANSFLYNNGSSIGIGTPTPAALLHTTGTGFGEGNILFVGSYKSTPGDVPVSGTGTRMMWYPDKAAFRAGYVSGDAWDTGNIGDYSVAFGYSPKASGANSFSSGYATWASGSYTTAMGFYTNATGNNSFAIGSELIVPSFAETVIGRCAELYTPSSATSWVSTDRLFVVGNGLNSGTRSNALTILKNGNTGIGTSSPEAKLDVEGGSIQTTHQLISTIATGMPPLTVSSATLVSNLNADQLDGQHASSFASAGHTHQNLTHGTGVATFSYNGNSAATVGLTGQALALHNLANNGLIARTGSGTVAGRTITWSGNGGAVTNGDGITGNPVIQLSIGTGPTQVAAGDHTHSGLLPAGASGQTLRHDGSSWVSNSRLYNNGANIGIGTMTPTALLHTIGTGTGEGNVLFVGSYKSTPGDVPVSGNGTRMMWYPDKAAFRVGYVTGNHWDKDSIGIYSVATGYNTKAKGSYSTAMGHSTIASGDFSTAMGAQATASGLVSIVMGDNTTASGNRSAAIGSYLTAPSGYETVIGLFNTDYTPNSTTNWNGTDRLFVVGNGTSSVTRSNALVILKNGNTGIGTSTPAAKLDVAGGSIKTTHQLISTIATGTSPLTVSSATLVSNLNADLLDGLNTGNSSGNIPVSNGTLTTNLNADMHDSYHAGNSSGNIPVSNGTLNTNLNADMVDGTHQDVHTEWLSIVSSSTTTYHTFYNATLETVGTTGRILIRCNSSDRLTYAAYHNGTRSSGTLNFGNTVTWDLATGDDLKIILTPSLNNFNIGIIEIHDMNGQYMSAIVWDSYSGD